MDADADIVIAGAGHNSLLTACYLAKAGYSCLALDARPIPGGGAATEELVLPGFGIDTCATGHTMIRANPALLNDELGLVSRYGLRYVEPDPVAQVAFGDGEQFTMWLDAERTAAEVARFSKADAAAYRRLLAEYDEVRSVFSETQFTPVGFGPSLEQRLASHPRGRIWARRRQLSAVEVVQHEFTSRHVQAFLLWMAFQVFQPVDLPGSGVLPYQQTFGRQRQSWSIPVGGSGRLTAALTGFLADHGGEIRCGERVERLVLDGGRCVGVQTAAGDQYRAAVAVVSSIHIKHLRDMAPREAWPEEFHYGVDTYDVGVPGFATYYCTTAAPQFTGGPSAAAPRSAVSAGLAGWPEDMIQMGADLRSGRYLPDPAWVLVATPTLADPGRAPAGQHTVKILSPQSYQAPGGAGWEAAKEEHARRQLSRVRRHAPNLTEEVILAQLTKSPADIEQLNPHMIHGAFHGGNRGPAFSGPLRPVPGWASHRMPIPGLYQTGGSTHPGGSITGAPGRNAAIVILTDLGHDLAEEGPACAAGSVTPGQQRDPAAT
jgi:phytoene dehydrogenase-like protein